MGVDASLYRVHQDGTGPRRRRLERVAAVMDPGDVVARLPETHPGRFISRIKPYGSLVLHSDDGEFIALLTQNMPIPEDAIALMNWAEGVIMLRQNMTPDDVRALRD